MTVVRDTIRQTLPSLLRIFTAVEDPVCFQPSVPMPPRRPRRTAGGDQLATALARQATDYARWALFAANPGWTILHDALLDALTRKAGWVRWHWGTKQHIRTEVCEGLLLPQLQMLLAEPGIEASRIVRRPMLPPSNRLSPKPPRARCTFSKARRPSSGAPPSPATPTQAWPHVSHVPAESVWIDARRAPIVETAQGGVHRPGL